MKNMLRLIMSLCIFIVLNIPLIGKEIIVAPNPWIPESQKVTTGNLIDGISFINLPEQGEILIYTISGDLVKRLEFFASSNGTQRWLGRNEENQYVASGVYFWVVQSPDLVRKGKLIIIR